MRSWKETLEPKGWLLHVSKMDILKVGHHLYDGHHLFGTKQQQTLSLSRDERCLGFGSYVNYNTWNKLPENFMSCNKQALQSINSKTQYITIGHLE
jgi:hypothetical protein